MFGNLDRRRSQLFSAVFVIVALLIPSWNLVAVEITWDEFVFQKKMADQKMADQGDVDAQVKLGMKYRYGFDVAVDYSKAVHYYQLAADQGDADAQFSLGVMYSNGLGVAVDKSKALQYFQLVADQGNANGHFILGVIYDKGDGVAVDKSKAVHYYQLAADQGDADAQFSLGKMYYKGDGVAVDKSKALQYFQLVADQGHADAQFSLGVMYSNGLGVAVDKSKAVHYYQLAADQGHADGQFNLGKMYYNGDGVAVDKSKALQYFRLAADQGHEGAIGFLELMPKVMMWSEKGAKTSVGSSNFYASVSYSREGERRFYIEYEVDTCDEERSTSIWTYNTTPVRMHVQCSDSWLSATPLSNVGHNYVVNLFKKSSSDINVNMPEAGRIVPLSAMGFTKAWSGLVQSAL